MDDDDFARFAADRGEALYRFGYVLAGNPHDAADLVQEALTRLRGAWPTVRGKANPEAYVRTTMTRLHVNTWRRRRREWLGEVPERPVLDAEYDDSVWRAVRALPPRQRAVLVLRYYEGLSDQEIAEALGVSRGTVRSQAARALGKLREPQESIR